MACSVARQLEEQRVSNLNGVSWQPSGTVVGAASSVALRSTHCVG